MYENMQLVRAIEKTQIIKWSRNMRKRRLVLTHMLQHFREKDDILEKKAVM